MRPLRSFFNLSYRYKIPLWGAFLIVATAVIISGAQFPRAYDNIKHDLLRNATSQGQILARMLAPALRQDQVWQAYEIIDAPLHDATPDNTMQADTLLVLDARRQVYVSTRPHSLPMLADFARRSVEYGQVAASIAKMGKATRVIEPEASDYLYVATPIVDVQTRLGTLVQVYSKKLLWPRIEASVEQAGWVALLALAVLVPLNWYWGHRTATPLLRLTERMEQLSHELPDELPTKIWFVSKNCGRVLARVVCQVHDRAKVPPS